MTDRADMIVSCGTRLKNTKNTWKLESDNGINNVLVPERRLPSCAEIWWTSTGSGLGKVTDTQFRLAAKYYSLEEVLFLPEIECVQEMPYKQLKLMLNISFTLDNFCMFTLVLGPKGVAGRKQNIIFRALEAPPHHFVQTKPSKNPGRMWPQKWRMNESLTEGRERPQICTLFCPQVASCSLWQSVLHPRRRYHHGRTSTEPAASRGKGRVRADTGRGQARSVCQAMWTFEERGLGVCSHLSWHDSPPLA